MDEKTLHLLKIRLRINFKHYGSLILVLGIFAGAYFLVTHSAETHPVQKELAAIQAEASVKSADEMRLPPQFFRENPPLESMKNSERSE